GEQDRLRPPGLQRRGDVLQHKDRDLPVEPGGRQLRIQAGALLHGDGREGTSGPASEVLIRETEVPCGKPSRPIAGARCSSSPAWPCSWCCWERASDKASLPAAARPSAPWPPPASGSSSGSSPCSSAIRSFSRS